MATVKKAGKVRTGTGGGKASAAKTLAVKAKTTLKAGVKKAAAGSRSAASGTGKAASKAVGKEKPKSLAVLEAGKPAPDFELRDDAGNPVTLGQFRGKKVVLYFYPKDSTPGCTRESCDFRDNLARIGEKGAIVLGLSADSVDSHRRFKAKQGLNFPLLSDPERRALEAYGVWQEKSLYGRKFMGIVRTTVLIDEKGRVAKVFPKVKVDGHVDEVLASL